MLKYIIILISIVLFGCNSIAPITLNPYDGLNFKEDATNGITNDRRLEYYRFNYGVEWLPYRLLSNLRRPNSFGLYDQLFLTNPERFGLYRNPIDPSAPPIGITVGTNGMTGINCSTCHTAVIAHEEEFFIVDGANSTFAIDRYIKEMLTSMIFTLLEPGEFEDLYERMYGKHPNQEFTAVPLSVYLPLQKDLESYREGKEVDLVGSINSFTAMPVAKSIPQETRFGLYVYMLKRISFFIQQTQFAKSTPGTADPTLGQSNPWSSGKILLANKLLGKTSYPYHLGGPVNTPSLWGYRNSQEVFRSGVTNNMVERNTIQGIALLSDFNWQNYSTTLSIRSMQKIEQYTQSISPPKWNEDLLGKIDRAAAQQGGRLFKSRCQGCHQEDEGKRRTLPYIDVGTDPQYHLGQTDFYGKDFFANTIDPFLKSVKKKMAEKEGINILQYEDGRVPSEWHTPTGNVFEAIDLHGCWASAPYLHNGSVRTIRELMKPAVERSRSFNVGSLHYNTADLGFEDEEVWWGGKEETDCKNCLGNSPQGHEFGTDLLDSEVTDLIEFLKSY